MGLGTFWDVCDRGLGVVVFYPSIKGIEGRGTHRKWAEERKQVHSTSFAALRSLRMTDFCGPNFPV